MATSNFWTRLKVQLARLKAWIKKNLPGWLKAGILAGAQWLIPFLLQHGMTFLVTEKAKARCEAAKLPREAVKIPPELEHEDDC